MDNMHFYNATTLLPLERRQSRQLDGFITQMSFHEETDTDLLGCASGSIFLYNSSSDELKNLRKRENPVITVTLVNSNFYAYLVYDC